MSYPYNLDDYQDDAFGFAFFDDGQGVNYTALGLAGEAGEFCDIVKKVIRDDLGVWTDEAKAKAYLELGDVLWYVAANAKLLGLSLQQIAHGNIRKLRSRKERGTMGGSGDER